MPLHAAIRAAPFRSERGMAEMPEPDWMRSSFCETGSCVEVAFVGDNVALRDSKELDGPILQFSRSEWVEFLDGARKSDR
jgi:Domain of unknown function (DUF397)